jgi:hypothetical protein|tara:strand:- start:2230 stop:2403 length:174 start_codon:yes stop_codon:yes gene_type:complete
MANYSVVDQVTKKGTLTQVADALETLVEAVDNTKTIRLLQIENVGGNQFQGVFVYDA